MQRVVLCTGNAGKIAEFKALLPPSIEWLSLADVGFPDALPETGETLYANALQKARHVFVGCGIPCIADDTGLEVDALNGEPGVYSARYAGEQKDTTANIRKLLDAMRGKESRTARFRTVIALVDHSGEQAFEGTIEGRIAQEPRGTAGFGYDPVFIPEGSSLTFAEMSAQAKNAVSHRARALQALLSYVIS